MPFRGPSAHTEDGEAREGAGSAKPPVDRDEANN